MTNPITSTLDWIEGTLLGTVATAVAVIAVAWIGFLMLSGRIDVRRSTRVILGCFIIFGASTIAAGIQAAIFGSDSGATTAEADALPYYPPAAPVPSQSVPAATDPYAGAAVPRR